MANLFISFLGTGDYQPVKCDGMDQKLIFVQTAILMRKCSHWNPEDTRVLFLCTPEAKDKSWEALNDEFRTHLVALRPRSIDIRMPGNEQRMWDLFNQVVKEVEENDRIVFDITHSFRCLPMLFTVLIQYLRIVRRIDLEGVFYGVYEDGKQEAALLDLTPFMALYDWSRAINDFISYGQAGELSEMALVRTNSLLAATKG